MPSRRSNVEMSPDEIRRYLNDNVHIILVSNGPRGFPHPVPMNYIVDDKDRIIVTAFGKSQKVVNLRRDPHASLLVETGDAYHEYKSVVAYATSEIIEDPAAVADVFWRVSEKIRARLFRRWKSGRKPRPPLQSALS